MLKDDLSRRQIVTQIEESQIVEASAGTGKTKILVDRLIEVVAKGAATIGNIVVVTFTEKAAAELKLRIRESLESCRELKKEEERSNIERALYQLEDARIGTIHSFCADILREYPIEAQIDPDFQILGEELSGLSLFEQKFDRWFAQEAQQTSKVIEKLTLKFLMDKKSPNAKDSLHQAAKLLMDYRDLDRPWSRIHFDLNAETRSFIERVLFPFVNDAHVAVDKKIVANGKMSALFSLGNELRKSEAAIDYNETIAKLSSLNFDRYLNIKRTTEGDVFAERFQLFFNELKDYQKKINVNFAVDLQEKLKEFVCEFQEQKEEEGKLDFLDLLLKTRTLLKENQTIRLELSHRFTHIFVDEFQDTDPLQAEIILLLSSEEQSIFDSDRIIPKSGKIFFVGDPKQSIYRFRRADVEFYRQLEKRLVATGSVKTLKLETSFRSVKGIQRVVNATFSNNELIDNYSLMEPYRDDIPKQSSVIGIPIPNPYGKGYRKRITKKAIKENEPEAIANWIKWLLDESGYRVSLRQNQNELIPLKAHHICLLFRSMQNAWQGDLIRPYVEALEERGISNVVMGGKATFNRPEIESLTNALKLVEWPQDEAIFYSALRGSLFGFSDADLLRYRLVGGRFRVFGGLDRLEEDERDNFKEISAIFESFSRLHKTRNHRPFSETLADIFTLTRCLSGFIIRPNGDQVVASAYRLLDIVRRFQKNQALSFRALVEYLEGQLDANRSDADSPIVETGKGGVRMMSVHRSKGLEFPVVVLCDASCAIQANAYRVVDRKLDLFAAPLCGAYPLEFFERKKSEDKLEKEEAYRLLYVAMTRARDILAIPTLPSSPEHFESWLEPIYRLLRRNDDVLNPADASSSLSSALAAGVVNHSIEKDDLRSMISWAKPEHFSGVEKNAKPLRDADLIVDKGFGKEESLNRFRDWKKRHAARVESLKKKTWNKKSTTEIAHYCDRYDFLVAAKAENVEVIKTETADKCAREGDAAKRFGSFVHEVLEHEDIFACSDGRLKGGKNIENVLGERLKRCGEKWKQDDLKVQEEAFARIQAALRHPLMVAARTSEMRFQELPIVHALKVKKEKGVDPTVIEGIVDLAFIEKTEQAKCCIVVDYKTDKDPTKEQIAGYTYQVALYQHAMEERLGMKTKGYLFFI